MAHLTTPQRNTLLAVLRTHPLPYEVRGAAVLPLRLTQAGALVEIEALSHLRRFQLTPAGLERASRLAARRIASSVAVPRPRPKLPGAGNGAEPTPPRCEPGQPENWPFPVSAHRWTR
jgi:hypothetical protein